MLADVYGCPVKTVKSKEGPSLGVAILAAVGTGVYNSVEEACNEVIKVNEPQNPIASNSSEYEKFYAVYRSLYGALKENYKALSAIK